MCSCGKCVFLLGPALVASIMMFAGPNVRAARCGGITSTTTGLGYIAAALVTGLSCIGGGIAVAKYGERGAWSYQ